MKNLTEKHIRELVHMYLKQKVSSKKLAEKYSRIRLLVGRPNIPQVGDLTIEPVEIWYQFDDRYIGARGKISTVVHLRITGDQLNGVHPIINVGDSTEDYVPAMLDIKIGALPFFQALMKLLRNYIIYKCYSFTNWEQRHYMYDGLVYVNGKLNRDVKLGGTLGYHSETEIVGMNDIDYIRVPYLEITNVPKGVKTIDLIYVIPA